MPRKLQPVQVVTYRKKITYKNPENTSKPFWDTIFGVLLSTVISIAAGLATGGIGGFVIEGLALSETVGALAEVSLQTLINFGVNLTMDVMTQHLTKESLLWDTLFSVTDLGKIGRGFKSDKLIKLINEAHLFKEIGFDEELKNFYKLKQFFQMKDVILKDQTKIAFEKVTDDVIFQTIFKISDSAMKKELKSLSIDELRRYMEIQRVLYQINPKLFNINVHLNEKLTTNILNNELKMSFDDFLKLDDLEAANALFKLSTTNVGQTTLRNLNLVRMQSRFQKSLFQRFKDFYKNIKNKLEKLNPLYWIKQFFSEVKGAMGDFVKRFYDAAVGDFWQELTSKAKDVIKKYGLIPCQPDSFLLGYRFEPLIDGSGYLTIFKKPYVWKKQARISNYNPVRVWTNLIEVEQFATASSQNQFYLDNWALGFGFKQAKFKVLNFVDPKLKKILTEINHFHHEIDKLHAIIELGPVKSVKSISEAKLEKTINLIKNQTFGLGASLLHKIPGLSIFSSSILRSLKNQAWDYSWLKKDASNQTIRVIKKESKVIKNGIRNIS